MGVDGCALMKDGWLKRAWDDGSKVSSSEES
jgi:hypothetical protein